MNGRVELLDGRSAESLDACLRILKKQLQRGGLQTEFSKRRSFATKREQLRFKRRRSARRRALAAEEQERSAGKLVVAGRLVAPQARRGARP